LTASHAHDEATQSPRREGEGEGERERERERERITALITAFLPHYRISVSPANT